MQYLRFTCSKMFWRKFDNLPIAEFFFSVLADSDSSPLLWQELQLICFAQIKIGGDFWGEKQSSLQSLNVKMFQLFIGLDSYNSHNSYNLSNGFSLNSKYCTSEKLLFHFAFSDVTYQQSFLHFSGFQR